MKYPAIGTSKYGGTSPIGKRGHAANSGLTLIEVLIAMVVLLIGIYAVLKIFPAGFGIIEASRQRSVANSLAQAELERCKLLGENLYSLPEAIIATAYDGTFINDYDPSDLTPAQKDYFDTTYPYDPQPLWEPDSVYLPRTIIGERTLIPASGPGQYPFYMLQFAPVDYLVKDTVNPGNNILLQVYDANPFTRVPVGSTLSEKEYTVDNTSGIFSLDATLYGSRYFTVTYSWVNTDDGIVRTVVGELRTADSSGYFTAKAKQDNPTKFQMIPGSEKVYLQFQLHNPPGQGQFYLDTASLMTGVIYFNAADIGKAIGINYRVADWGILREDYEIPAGTTTIRVAALGGIKGPNYTNPPRQTAVQKLPDDVNFVVAINLADSTFQGDVSSSSGLSNLEVNYRTGAIQITAASAKTIRILYRGVRDWAVQVQKAASSYGLVPTSASPPSYNTFYWLTPTDVATPRNELDKHKILRFAPSEAGKTVALSYYRDVYDTGTGTWAVLQQYVADELVTINAGGAAYFCQKGNQDVRPSANNSFTGRGVSLTARAVWASSGRSIVPDTRTFSGRPEYLNEVWLQSRANGMLTVR